MNDHGQQGGPVELSNDRIEHLLDRMGAVYLAEQLRPIMIRLFGALLLAASVAASSEDASPRDAVRAVVEGIIAADNAGDLEKVLGFYADDAILLAPTGDDIVGKPNLRTHYQALFAQADLQISTAIDEIVTSGNWAIVRGVNHVVVTPVDGGPEERVSSKYLMTLKRATPAKPWRIAHLMWADRPADAADP